MSVESECPNCGAQYPEHPHMDWCRGDERTFAKPAQPVSEWKGEAREWWIDAKENRVVAAPGGYVSDYILNPQNGCVRVLEATPARMAAEQMLEALYRAVEVMQFAYMNAPEQPKEIAQALAAIAKAGGK